MQVPFVCSETHKLGKNSWIRTSIRFIYIVGWNSNAYGSVLSDNDPLRLSRRFRAGQEPRTEEPQLPSFLRGADGLSLFRELLGSPDIACFNCFSGVLSKPIGVVDQQQERCKIGPAT